MAHGQHLYASGRKGWRPSAKVVPSSGGETEFADMRAAYDELAPSTVEKFLNYPHSIHSTRAKQKMATKSKPGKVMAITLKEPHSDHL
ncbi:MAG: hypothetical protein CM15mP62_19950 [Rhodospirillaceae bacterium]|nr:MAG: hypothetical protein CM15mP62_19950 [Rhodospirillaceae bacterium]